MLSKSEDAISETLNFKIFRGSIPWTPVILPPPPNKSNLATELVLQGATYCYTVLHCVTRCYKVLHGVARCSRMLRSVTWCYTVLQG